MFDIIMIGHHLGKYKNFNAFVVKMFGIRISSH